jgi:Protein of unknown function DUF262/Protein of unknown function (DUF1524)
MANSISCQVSSVGSLLRAGNIYEVPPYQRNFAWEEDQYGVFWFDIAKTFSTRAPEYFLGSIVINIAQAPRLSVIDGQQRLITTAVLISALRNHLRAEGQSELATFLEHNFLVRREEERQLSVPCLVLNRSDKTFYDTYIFRARSAPEIYRLADDDTLSHSNRLLAECFRFMHRRLAELRSGEWNLTDLAQAIVDSLDSRVFVIRIDVKDDYDAFLLFETLNDRGLELSEADLLKNRLFAVSGESLHDVQANWDLMEQNLGSERLIKFVRHHWFSTRGQVGERGLYSDIKQSIAAPESATGYTAALCEASDFYAALSNTSHRIWSAFPHEQQPAIRDLIDTIEILRPEQLFIVLLAALEVDRRNFLELARMLVTFTFRYNTICSLSPSNILQPFIAAARHIRETRRADPAELFRTFLAALYPDDSQFHSAFARKVIRVNSQARYILARINDYLTANPSLRTQVDPFATDLEHILPRRYNRAWDTGRRDFPGGADKYVYRLGNMTLIAARLNRDLGNADFANKKRLYTQDKLEITRKVLDADKWTHEEIKNRQNWLASLACKIWRYPA